MTTPTPDQSKTAGRTGCVVLIGYRGCGKTTVGHILAENLGGDFIDTDDLIIERAGMSIAEIFEKEGEAGFRRREAYAVAEAIGRQTAVISAGGGAVLDPANVARLKSAGRVVWLTAPAEVLWERIQKDKGSTQSRPALTDRAGLDEVVAVLARRTPLYEEAADFQVDTSGLSPADVARRCGAHLSEAQD